MPDKDKKQVPPAANESTAPEMNNPDFQNVLKALLAAYQPVLEQQLNLAKNPQELQKEAQNDPPNCADEFAEANALFGKFLSDDIALRLIPEKNRAQIGPIENWRWCLQHIRCCIVFGWLVCRGPRTFRAWAYYVYQYWLCVRQSLGTPVASPPTEEQRNDFSILIGALAKAYKPYLTDQLASVEFPSGIPDAVLSGEIDCFEGQDDTCAIFDRLLTSEAAQALLGKSAFASRSQDQNFWFCRCWCLCSICFGCCLARARNFIDVLYCLVYYFRCLVNCFQPLTCDLTGPQGCVNEVGNIALHAIGVEIDGTAAGAGFSHYILEWSQDFVTWNATNFNYPPIPPGGGTQGNIPVISGELAFLSTSSMNEGPTSVRMTVFAVDGTTKSCGPITFDLFRQNVWISGIDNDFNLNTNPFDPAAQFIETVPALCTRPSGISEVSFGEAITVEGSAFVGGCAAKQIARYSLDYQPGFVTDPTLGVWTNFWNVVYNPADPNQFLVMNERRDNSELIAAWGPYTPCVPNPLPPPLFICGATDPQGELYPTSWPSTINPPCGLSGLFTLRLTVEDAASNLYYDTQRIWLDNKWPCAAIRINAVPPCAVVNLSQFANPPDCSVPWQLPLAGIAYDEYIDYTLPFNRPNDNFDFYWIKVSKQGGSWVQIPVLGPGGSCFFGTSRVGDPFARCLPGQCDPAHLDPSAVLGLLANFDLRALDPLCSSQVSYPVPPDLLLPRGQCCDYTFWLWVQDRTIFSGGPHWAEAFWPVRICNDLKG
jgi:hypothetical protein